MAHRITTRLLCSLLLSAFAAPAAYGQRPSLSVNTPHATYIDFIAGSPDGRLAVTSASDDRSIKLWDVKSGVQLFTFVEEAGVYLAAFSPDGKSIVSVNHNGVKVWDIASMKPSRKFAEEYASIHNAAVSDDRKTLILARGGEYGSKLEAWDVETGAPLRKFKDLSVPSLDYGRLLAVSSGKMLALKTTNQGMTERCVDLYDLGSKSETRTHRLTCGADHVQFLAFSSDGRKLVGSFGYPDMPGWPRARKTVRVWDTSTGKELSSWEWAGDALKVIFDADGKTVWGVDYGGAVALWDADNGKELSTGRGDISGISTVALTAGGDILTGNKERNSLRVISRKDSGALAVLARRGVSPMPAVDVAFSNNNRLLASAHADGTIRLWSLTDRTEVRRIIDTQDRRTMCLAFSPDDRIIASGGNSYTITLWDMTTGKPIRDIRVERDDITKLKFSPDGKFIYAQTGGSRFTAWEVATGKDVGTSSGFTDSGSYLIEYSAGRDPFVAEKGLVAIKSATDDPTPTIKLMKARPGIETAWELLNPGGGATLLSFEIKQYLSEGEEIAPASYESNAHRINLFRMSRDAKHVAGVTIGNEVKLWDVATRRVRTLGRHSNEVMSLAFSPDGRVLASTGFDAMIKLWDVAAGKELAALVALEGTDWAVATPDGYFDGTPEAWRQIRWRFSLDLYDFTPLEAYFDEFYYPDLLGDLYSPTRRPKALSSIEEKDRSLPLVSDLRVSADRVEIPAGGVSPARDVKVSVRVSEARKPGGARGGGVTDLRLFRNGVLVQIWKGDLLSPASGSGCAPGGAGEAVCSATVPVVEGDNRLLAYAFNRDNVKSEDAELTIRGPSGQKGAGRLYIIAVGINEYANKRFNLTLARPDALAFGRELERRQQSLGRAPEVVYLLDSEATKANLLLALRRLVRGEQQALPEGAPQQLAKLRPAEPEDTVVIYFAGHGLAWPARPAPRRPQRFYFIPHDLGYSGTRERILTGMPALTAHSLSDQELEEVVAHIDAESLLLVVDACNSGQVLESDEKRRGPLNTRGLAQLAYEKGMYVITAAQSYQAARALRRLGYGYLTYALIEEGLKRGLADAQPPDGSVLLREWFDYSAGRVPDLFRAEQRSRGPGEKRLLVHDDRPDTVPEVQQPRVFYRREPEAKPLVIANTSEQGARP